MSEHSKLPFKVMTVDVGDWVKIESPGLSDWFEVTEIVTKHPPNVASMKPLPILFSGMIEIPKDDITAHRTRLHTEGSPFRVGDQVKPLSSDEILVIEMVSRFRDYTKYHSAGHSMGEKTIELIKPVEAIEQEREAKEPEVGSWWELRCYSERWQVKSVSDGVVRLGREGRDYFVDEASLLVKDFWKIATPIEAERDHVPDAGEPEPELADLIARELFGPQGHEIYSFDDVGYRVAKHTVEHAKAIIRQLISETSDKPRPTLLAETINSLPQNVRDYIHDLETRYDMSGTIQENHALKENIEALKEKPRLTPIAGPPDLEGVPDDALFAYGWTGSDGTRYSNCKNAKAMRMVVAQVGDELDWYIPLGVVEEPKPEPQQVPNPPDYERKTKNGTVTVTYDEETCKAVLEANGYTVTKLSVESRLIDGLQQFALDAGLILQQVPAAQLAECLKQQGYTVTKLTESDKPCPNDTNGDGDCGRKYCPYCGEPFPVQESEVTLEDYIRERCGGFLRYYRDPEWAVIADEIQRKFIK